MQNQASPEAATPEMRDLDALRKNGSPYLTGVLQVAASRPARPDC